MDDNLVPISDEAARQNLQAQLHFDLRLGIGDGCRTTKRDPYRLTSREGTIIAYIGTGRSNKEIARELGVTPETIKSHLKRIFLKLSANTRAEAVARAQRIDLLALPPNGNSTPPGRP